MNTTEITDEEAERSDSSSHAAFVVAVAVVACVLTVARRPDALFHAQFWAEDGTIFFQQAWNHGGFNVLTTTYAGYLEEIPRLVAIPGVAMGLHWAPLWFNLVALVCQVAPAVYFASDRCESLVNARHTRVLIAAVYLLLPNAEIDLTLTNVQWHLAILAFLIVAATPARHTWVRISEGLVLALVVMSGPFGLLLVPAAAIWYWRRRDATTRAFLAIATVGTLLQITASLLGPGRPHPNLGASVDGFVEIVANRVFLAGAFGQDENNQIITSLMSEYGFPLEVLVFALGYMITAFVFWRGPLALKLFIAFSGAIVIGGLVSPPGATVRWSDLIVPPNGARDFFMAEIAWLLSLMWIVTRLRSKALGAALVVLVCIGVAWGVFAAWPYRAFLDLHPDFYARSLDRAAKGTVVKVPVNPSPRPLIACLRHGYLRSCTRYFGEWTMQLVAR